MIISKICPLYLIEIMDKPRFLNAYGTQRMSALTFAPAIEHLPAPHHHLCCVQTSFIFFASASIALLRSSYFWSSGRENLLTIIFDSFTILALDSDIIFQSLLLYSYYPDNSSA